MKAINADQLLVLLYMYSDDGQEPISFDSLKACVDSLPAIDIPEDSAKTIADSGGVLISRDALIKAVNDTYVPHMAEVICETIMAQPVVVPAKQRQSTDS